MNHYSVSKTEEKQVLRSVEKESRAMQRSNGQATVLLLHLVLEDINL